MSNHYDSAFFAQHESLSRQSAAQTVPLLLKMVPVKSVVDVGCGIGTWLSEIEAAGITDYLGVDGSYVSQTQLLIEPQRFVAHELTQPLHLDRRFDLAMCLEVAEHLPSESAQTLVDSLVGLAPVVLFSAAIPFQQGEDHINEQWPEYWYRLFARHDYVAVDALRRKLWRNTEVARWYSQNLLFYVQRQRLHDYPPLAAVFEADGNLPPLSLVHPEHYLWIYRGLFDALRQARFQAIRATLQLREINLVAFPDWNQPPKALHGQMRELCEAIATHPQQPQLCVVLHLGNDPQRASGMVEQASHMVQLPPGSPAQMAPSLRGVGPAFGRERWETLLAGSQGRIILPAESSQTLADLPVEKLPVISLAALQQKQTICS